MTQTNLEIVGSARFFSSLLDIPLYSQFDCDPPMPSNHTEIEKRLWDAADELRANSKLKSSNIPSLFSTDLPPLCRPKFTELEKKLVSGNGRRKIGRTDLSSEGCALPS